MTAARVDQCNPTANGYSTRSKERTMGMAPIARVAVVPIPSWYLRRRCTHTRLTAAIPMEGWNLKRRYRSAVRKERQ